ncbi:MAG: mobile mystery protein A [Bacteroidia bacterium]|nr:mobile mystery protein A [Bacteroidia bacterium]
MKKEYRKLAAEQLDRKLGGLRPLLQTPMPDRGWIHAIRRALGMSLRQLAVRMDISPQSVKEMEDREAEGSITLKRLREAAEAMDLYLVYFVIPKEQSLGRMISKQAESLARSIVLRTATSMELEEQGVSEERIASAVRAKTEELIREMPRYLWDQR